MATIEKTLDIKTIVICHYCSCINHSIVTVTAVKINKDIHIVKEEVLPKGWEKVSKAKAGGEDIQLYRDFCDGCVEQDIHKDWVSEPPSVPWAF